MPREGHPHPHDIHFGNKARELRLMHDLSQNDLAGKMFLSFQQVQKYETGANRISARRLGQLCSIFSVGPQYFYDGVIQQREDTSEAGARRSGILRWASRLEALSEKRRDAIKELIVVLGEDHEAPP